MNQTYETIYFMPELTFIYPFDILLVLLIPFSILLLVSYKKKGEIDLKLVFLGGVLVLMLPYIFSYIRFNNIKKNMASGEVKILSGKVESIRKFSAQDVVNFSNISLTVSRKSIYCLSNRNLLNPNDDVVISYYDLGKNTNITRANICIVKIEKK